MKNKKIVNFILEYPLEDKKNISFFIPLLKDKFKNIDLDFLENLEDPNNENTYKFYTELLNTRNKINYAIDEITDFYIVPSEKSKNLAINDTVLFEKKCIEYLNTKESDKEKGMFFELIVQFLLEQLGIITETTKASGDEGLDLFGISSDIEPLMIKATYFIQCKYYSNSPDINLVKKVLSDVLYNVFNTSNNLHHPIIPIIICKENPSGPAQEFADKNGVKVFTFKKLIEVCSSDMKLDFNELLNHLTHIRPKVVNTNSKKNTT